MQAMNADPIVGQRPKVLCAYCYVNGTCSGGCRDRLEREHKKWIEANKESTDVPPLH